MTCTTASTVNNFTPPAQAKCIADMDKHVHTTACMSSGCPNNSDQTSSQPLKIKLTDSNGAVSASVFSAAERKTCTKAESIFDTQKMRAQVDAHLDRLKTLPGFQQRRHSSPNTAVQRRRYSCAKCGRRFSQEFNSEAHFFCMTKKLARRLRLSKDLSRAASE